MAESRFDKYVRERLADETKARRDELVAAVDEAEAKIDAKIRALEEIAENALAEANAKIRALAKKWGWTIAKERDDGAGPCRLQLFESEIRDLFRETMRDYYPSSDDTRCGRRALKSSAKLMEALDAFDKAVEKAARRLVVVKKDLGMKAEAFDKAMADAVAKLLK